MARIIIADAGPLIAFASIAEMTAIGYRVSMELLEQSRSDQNRTSLHHACDREPFRLGNSIFLSGLINSVLRLHPGLESGDGASSGA